MERPIFKPIGTSVEELDTPSLVVDLSLLDKNIETMHSFFREANGVKLRPSIESHLCPPIAHKQLSAGGTMGGICASTLGQADVFAANGFSDILIANIVVTDAKIRRLCALARHCNVTVAVDNPENVASLSAAASASGVTLNVMVAVYTGSGPFGVQPGGAAADLAVSASSAPGLHLAGLMTNGAAGDEAGSRDALQQLLDARESVERAGMRVETVSAGDTRDYDIAASMDGVTEVRAGSYALMDGRNRALREEFTPAAKIVSSITSLPEPGNAITDAGRKAIGEDVEMPSVDGLPGAEIRGLSAEHGGIDLPDVTTAEMSLGDKVWLTPWDIGACANLHDYIFGARDGKLEVVWAVAARGRYR